MEIIRALEETWTAVESRLSSLDASQWSLPTPNTEWDTKDLAAHLGGLEAMFQGFPQPDPPPGWTTEHTGLHQMTALGVAARRSWTTDEVLDELRRASDAQLDKLRGLDDEGWQQQTLGPVGMTTEANAADIRLGDIFVHLLDLRYTLGEPLTTGLEPTAERLTVERAVALTGWGAVKGAGLPDGTRIRLELSGPGGVGAVLSAGIGTLLFHLVTKGVVPVFLGSSFAFIAPILLAQAEGYSFLSIGVGIVGAGVVYLIVATIVRFVPDGSLHIRNLFPPVVTGPVIAVIGITLAPVAINQAKDNWWLALATLGMTIVAAIWFRGLFKMLPILTGFISGYIIAVIFGQVDFAALNAADWLAWPDFGGVFGGGEFDFSVVWLIAPVALVTMIEHVGDILTNGRVVGRDFFQNPGVNRTLLGDGLATLFAGLVGGPPNTTYSENTGVLAVTRVYDPRVLRIGAVFAILLGFIPKFGGLLQTVPVPVLGGLSIVLFGMIASIGMRVLADAQVDFTHSRNLIVVALIMVIGLGFGAFDQVTTLLGASWDGLPQIGDVKLSGLALAALVGVVANLVLPKAIDEEEVEPAVATG